MSKTYWAWVSEQLNAIGVTKNVENVVVDVLHKIKNEAWSDAEAQAIVDLIVTLNNEKPLFEDVKPNEVWVQMLPGEYGLGTVCRVHDDAYPQNVGHKHNGKRGRVAGMRGAKAIVIYDDALSSEDQHYHNPAVLDRLT